MKITCQSEVGSLHTIFIKHAKDALINDTNIDKEWQILNFTARPNLQLALEEYARFESFIKETGAKINYLPQNDTVTMDSMYCRDASIATDAGMILCTMGKVQRIPEPLAEKAAFLENNIPILGRSGSRCARGRRAAAVTRANMVR